MSSAPDSRRLEQLGEYAIRRVIGEGGMGIVYDAVERLSGMRVALKVLHSNLSRSQDARARFFAEMRILASLRHPNIVQSLASREIEGKLVIVLEYLEGKTLRETLHAAGRLDATRVTSIARAVASALVAAHESPQSIVHRDLKPENLMLLADGSVKVMDFGVAKVLGDSGGSATTQVVGTVLYMSPEQAEGRTITPRTDLYALGLVMYEALSGRPLFESPSLVAVLRHHCETPPPPFADDVRQQIPAELERLIFRLLEKSPAARPDAREVLLVLDALAAPAHAASPTMMVAASQPRFTPAPEVDVVSGPPAVAAAVVVSPGSPRVEPRASGTPLDTIGLIDRYDRRTRWRWFAAGGALLVAAGAGVGIWWWLSIAPPKKSTKTAAAGVSAGAKAAAPVTPGSANSPPCPVDACAPLDAPNLRAVDVDFLMARSDALALSVDPQARLRSVSFIRSFHAGTVDTIDVRAFSFIHYDTAEGSLAVRMVGGGLQLNKAPPEVDDRAGVVRACPFANVWSVAVATGLHSTDMDNVTLTISPLTHDSQWIFSSMADDSVQVDAQTCVLKHHRAGH